MTTEAGNMLIAEFMGYQNRYAQKWYTDGHDSGFYIDAATCYHSSWDWLMPVVEKIHTLPEFFTVDMGAIMINNLSMDSHLFYCVIKNSSRRLLGDSNGSTLKEATYQAVVQFIEWLNKETKYQQPTK